MERRFSWWIVLAIIAAFLLIVAVGLLLVTQESDDGQDRGDGASDESPQEVVDGNNSASGDPAVRPAQVPVMGDGV